MARIGPPPWGEFFNLRRWAHLRSPGWTTGENETASPARTSFPRRSGFPDQSEEQVRVTEQRRHKKHFDVARVQAALRRECK